MMKEDKVNQTDDGMEVYDADVEDKPLGETAHAEGSDSEEDGTKKVVDPNEDDDSVIEPNFFTDEEGNLKFVNLVVRYPCAIFWTILVLCVILTFLLITILAREENPFTNPENQFDMKDVRSIQYDSLRLAHEEVEEARAELAAAGSNVQLQSEFVDITYWVFESEIPEGVFGTRNSLEAMKDAFDIFTEDKDYETYCLKRYEADGSSTCDLPLSSLSMYYASEWDHDLVANVIEELKDPDRIDLFNNLSLCFALNLYCDLLPEEVSSTDVQWVTGMAQNISSITSTWDLQGELNEDINQVTELASYMIQLDIYKGFVDFGFDKEFSSDNPVSKFSRGIILWGGPLEQTLEELKDEEDVDDEGIEKKDQDLLTKYIKDTAFDEMEDMAKRSSNDEINSYYFMGALILDVLLEIVARDGMLALFSLVFVFIWLRINTGSFFLAGVGILEIFLSLPVAWFIFAVIFQVKYFAFLNSLCIFIVAAIGADDIFIFMDAYRQSGFRNPQNLVSLEKRMSWVYRRTGTAMAITSATTCAAFLCTLVTPLSEIQSFGIFAACVIFIDYVLVMTLFCTAVVIYHNKFEGRKTICGCCTTNCEPPEKNPTEAARDALLAGEADTSGDRVSEFFRTKVADFVKAPLHRVVLFLVFATWIAIAVWQTAKIEPTKETEQFLDEDHPLQRSIDILNNEFPTADDDLGLQVYYAWGLREVDRKGVNLLFDPENYGKPRFEEEFDFNEQCQTELLKACDKLKTDSDYIPYIKRNEGLGSVFCFIEELAAYNVRGNLDDCDYVRQGGWRNETWQVSAEDLPTVMSNFIEERSSCYDDTETILGRYEYNLGWDGEKLRYASISVESDHLDPFSQKAESFVRKQYNAFIDIGEELDAVVSEHCSGTVVVTDLDEKFVFMNNQAIYVRTAVQSSLLGVGIAFTVLLLTTRVLHIAVFASLSIMSVLVSVTGVMVMLGWYLGSIESILIGIIAGFSVDYVVHLAHAYETAKGNTYQRITAAFGDMGISVMNGMITSVAASIPLFFCQLQFFAKFGTFLCLTIAFSWIFANFAFMSVLATAKIPIKKTGCRL